MAEVTLGRVGVLLRCMFELLWNKSAGLPASEIIAILPEIAQLTEHELGSSHASRIPRYERILRLATVPLFEVGWLVKTKRGRWSITNEGRDACRNYSDPQELYEAALRLLDAGMQRNRAIHLATGKAEEQAWEQIQSYLLEMHQTKFRSLIVDLLTVMGCHFTWFAHPSTDHGPIDMVARKDPLNFEEPQILVQIKHKGQPLTIEGLRSFLTLLGSNHRGLLISSGGFTEGVRDELRKNITDQVALLDLETFFDLWIKNYDKLSDEARSRLPIRAIYFLGEII